MRLSDVADVPAIHFVRCAPADSQVLRRSAQVAQRSGPHPLRRVPTLPSLTLASLLLVTQAAAGQSVAAARFEYTEIHMAMPVRIVLYASDAEAARRAARAAFQRVAELEDVLSDYRARSEVRRLEERAGEWVPVSPELFRALETALHAARLTDGAFDPTVAPLVALWREARRTKRLPAATQLDSARKLVSYQRVSLDSSRRAVRLAPGTRLDLGGVAKGFILDEAKRELRRNGVGIALLEAGGDIVAGDAPPGRAGWTVDVPGASPAFAARASRLVREALSTSGPDSQFVVIRGKRYSHVVDPRSGYGLTGGCTASVIASDAALADALATAVTVRRVPSLPTLRNGAEDAIIELRPASTVAPDPGCGQR
jgi:thiamine biosynthesis lipoprotein